MTQQQLTVIPFAVVQAAINEIFPGFEFDYDDSFTITLVGGIETTVIQKHTTQQRFHTARIVDPKYAGVNLNTIKKPARDAMIKDLINKGADFKSIALALDLSQAAISRIASEGKSS